LQHRNSMKLKKKGALKAQIEMKGTKEAKWNKKAEVGKEGRRDGGTEEAPSGACANERLPELGTNGAVFGFSVSGQIPILVPDLFEDVGPARERHTHAAWVSVVQREMAERMPTLNSSPEFGFS
ncbi:hypothetical protein BT96DRAFT_952166, partial [Gymnopus androsaceus JB14]